MYHFINISDGGDAKPSDHERRTLIRRHVMKQDGKKRKRKEKNPRINHEFRPVNLGLPATASSSNHTIGLSMAGNTSGPHQKVQFWPQMGSLLPYISYREPGFGRRNPFESYPVPMTSRMHAIVDCVLSDSLGTLCLFHDTWLPVCLTEPATFHQFLSNVAWNLSARVPSDHQIKYDSMAHHAIAIRSLKQRVSNIGPRNAAGTISTILTLAVHANLSANDHALQLHLDAISTVINQLGGMKSIEIPAKLRLLMFWTDVLICTRQDEHPRFPLPTDALPPLGYRDGLSEPLLALLPDQTDELAKVLMQLHQFGEVWDYYMQSQGKPMCGLAQSIRSPGAQLTGSWINPLLYQLLSLRPKMIDETDPISTLREATRLGAMLSLATFRRKAALFKVISDVQVDKLQYFLQLHLALETGRVDWVRLEPLKLWLLMMAGMESSVQEQRAWFIHQLTAVAHNMRLKTWGQAQLILLSMFWVGDALDESGRALWEDSRTSTMI